MPFIAEGLLLRLEDSIGRKTMNYSEAKKPEALLLRGGSRPSQAILWLLAAKKGYDEKGDA
jgi:hypothetical protein